VATTFVLRALSLNGEPLGEPKRLHALPIRIGRNGLNDFVVLSQGVSSFHARIDDVEGRLCITDLASKNGVLLVNPGHSGAIPPNQPFDLQPGNFQFFLGVHVRVQLTFEEQREPIERMPTSFTGHVLGNAGALHGSMVPAPHQGSTPPPVDPGFMPPVPKAAPLPGGSLPGNPSADAGGRRPSTAFLQGLTAEAMALQGLRELAASLVPGAPLETTGDIARFITKLHDAIDAFIRSFIPLREGHAQFMSSFDLQRAMRRSVQRSQGYMAVENARSAEALAAALLDPKDRSYDAPQAVEGILADLMLHQLALLEGVMRGVRALLEELSPENVEQRTGGGLSFARHRALWSKYLELYENVSEERQAFSVIFGPEFTAAYRQYRTGGDGSG
jgi:type VI secretion system protein ImpI